MGEGNGGHVLRITFDSWIRYEAVCKEPDGSDCRLTSVSCECEEWGEIWRRDDGTIWHRIVDEGPMEPLWHQLKPAPYCNICEFLNNYDIEECLVRGSGAEFSVPIKPVWTGDGYEWEPIEVGVSVVPNTTHVLVWLAQPKEG